MENSSKEKQIEEMAFNLIRATSPLGVKDLTKQFDYTTVATDLYNLYGWRKASEVAREIIADLDNGIYEFLKVYTEIRNREFMTDNPTEYTSGKIDAYWSVKVRLAELKKKYTESEKDDDT